MPTPPFRCLLFLLPFFYFTWRTSQVSGAVYFVTGDCPDEYKPGNVWDLPGKCERCRCFEDGYSCASCGVYALEYDKTNCYDYRDQSAEYPTCCNPIVKCRGDEGFDESFLVG